MRSLAISVWALLCCQTSAVSAGLYNTSETEEEKRSDPAVNARDWFPNVFHVSLLKLRSIGMPQVKFDNELRKRYILQADLASRLNPTGLTSEQKLNLSAVLIRRKKYDDAIGLLTPLARAEPKNFLVQSNLATAYQLVGGQDRRAIDTLEQALGEWPVQLGDVKEPFGAFLQSIPWIQSGIYRKAETYQLKLLKLRAREGLAGKGSKAEFETVDALFDDGKNPPTPLRFVGESGKFEPGKLARNEQAKLPKDAIDIVQQLLFWLPEDIRLYWLLGELYNAQGDIRSARMIFDELGGWEGSGVRTAEFADHRKELISYNIPEEKAAPFNLDDEENRRKSQAPRFDWETLGVAFGTGICVGIFGMWQLRELRRRRQNRAAIK